MNVVLLGMKHCGKSTVGRALAARRGASFYDTDELVEQLHARQFGQRLTFREIYRQRGAAFVENLEADAVAQLARQLADTGESAVVALGGRTPLNPLAADDVGRLGSAVWLDVEPEELLRRILAGGVPAFLDPADPEGSFYELYDQRRPGYDAAADVTVNLDGLDEDAAVAAVEQALSELE
jgi:shikimate kinase